VPQKQSGPRGEKESLATSGTEIPKTRPSGAQPVSISAALSRLLIFISLTSKSGQHYIDKSFIMCIIYLIFTERFKEAGLTDT
jgi:hypothetical protein